MPEHDLDPQFEQLLARGLRSIGDEGLRPFDAMQIAQAAATGTGFRATAVERTGPPTWFRAMVMAALLVVMLIAVALVGGFIRLPTGVVEPSGSPSGTPVGTLTAFSPDPSASFLPPDTPLPTVIIEVTPAPIATPGASGTPSSGSTPTTAPPTATLVPTTSLPPTASPDVPPTATAEVEPTVEPGPAVLTAVSSGDTHSCAIRQDRTIACWGFNEYGELGNGAPEANWIPPVTVVGIADAVAVSAGNRFTCAVRADGSVDCWGEGGSGQLGNGSTADSSVPVRVGGISDAVAIGTGGAHSCALRSGGGVACWGSGDKLGGGSGDASSTPVAVSGIADAVALAVGWNHACVLHPGGTMSCWGLNGDGATGYGQLGDGTFDNRLTPVVVDGIDDATAVSAGGWSTCALLADRSVRCWGYNERGGLGDGTTTNSPLPVQVVGLTDAVEIAVGGWHACARRANGSMVCWGANSWGGATGQLGDGSGTDSSTSVEVIGISDAQSIDASWIRSCALRADGSAWCWGGGEGTVPTPILVPPAEDAGG